ncbi:unnamed protein product [Ambrosiozyma monospora]|uniref:Unnamed protein product n=1 Tax=Ambrosiozyma monospora TaxID=43982 RepID=A0ACB5TRZ2_AMBMO|nr:unnamed protein product [Ambrosiozyma monospora]
MDEYKSKLESGGFDNPNDDGDDAASTTSATKKKRKKSTKKLILSATSAAAANGSDAPLSTDPVEPMSESVEDGEVEDGGDAVNTTIASSPAPTEALDVEDDASVAEPASVLDSITAGAAANDETTDEEDDEDSEPLSKRVKLESEADIEDEAD